MSAITLRRRITIFDATDVDADVEPLPEGVVIGSECVAWEAVEALAARLTTLLEQRAYPVSREQ